MSDTYTVLASAAATAQAQADPQASAAQPGTPAAPLRLLKLRRDAAVAIKNQIKIGNAIKSQRIANTWDLDQARAEKQEWVTRTTDLLNALFSDGRVAEECNDWVGPILPEYADFKLFVEQFVNEMKHRIGRLQQVLKLLDELPEPLFPRAASSLPGAEAAMPGTAQVPGSMEAFASLVPPSGSADSAEQTAQPQEEVFMIAQPAPVSVSAATAATVAPPPAVSPVSNVPTAPAAARQTPSPRLSSSGLLVLRCVDDPTRQAVASFFAALDLTLNVVDQRPADNRRPLVEALAQFADASFALILNDTPTNDGDYLFDLGCCVGKFGTGRLCLLQREDAAQQPPGDSRGVKQICIDPAGGWQLALARHLKSGGVAVDLNKLL
ncbi:MAG TPA: hypothetical protein VNL70_04090 [Tepidisphaeraceae bacterium]|nr:hypothetical protein [Tepidisphaeraceae bacterium]